MQMFTQNPDAVARIRGGEDFADVYGVARFYRQKEGVLVRVDVCGLPPGRFFALHIHEGCSCGGEDFGQTGGHYNPEERPHPFHAGDLPPLLSVCGWAHLSVLTDRFCLKDVLGRTVVIHEGPDDFTTQPAGNAGKKIACGVICRP